ncbi:MAG TPA: hypothetical protein PLZ32_15450, partial [Saprospiraceae bacterium]|nr:hypothetical protein [Saprospiraceae bacterium]
LVISLNGNGGFEDYQYFETLLSKIYHLLFCTCELNIHKSEIQYLTKCIIAEYYRRELHKDDITGTHGILRKILQFNTLKESKKVKNSEFPLPKNILNKKKSAEYSELVRDYLNSDNHNKLKLFGLLNFLKYDNSATFIFKIENIEICENQVMDFKFKSVNFFRLNDFFIEKFKIPFSWLERYDKYFSNENSIFASTCIDFKSMINAKNTALKNVEHSLNMVRYFINSKGGTISNRILIINDTQLGIHFEGPTALNLNDNNISDLYRYSIDLAEIDLNFEKIGEKMDSLYDLYIKGLSQSNDEDIITYFWKYFETAYSHVKGKKGEQIIKSVSKILSKEKMFEDKKELAFNIHHLALQNCESEIHGIPTSYYNDNRERNFYDDSDEIVHQLKQLPVNTFMKDLIAEYEKNIYNYELYSFYEEILWQVYEQRNFIQHNGISNHKSLEELKFYYDIIIRGWSSEIYKIAESNNSLDYKQIIALAEKVE